MPKGEVTLNDRVEECDVEWKIQDFLSLLKANHGFYKSPDFFFKGESWCLAINPCGSGGFINLRICRVSSNGPALTVKFCFAFKTVNRWKYLKTHSTGVFEADSYHDINGIVSICDFVKRQSEFLTSGLFTVACTLKRVTFTSTSCNRYVSCRNCKKYKITSEISRHERICNKRRIKCPNTKGANTSTSCSYSKRNVGAQHILTHEKKCNDRTIKCPACSDLVQLKNWVNGHDCPKKRAEECSYCKKNVDAENITMHEKECMGRLIKCPECSEVVLLQTWYDHQCQTIEGDGATVGCSHRKRSLDIDNISSRKKKCMDKSINFLDPLIGLQNSEMASVKEEHPKNIAGHHIPQESLVSPDSGIGIHLEALSRDLSKLFNKSSNSDVRILCEGKTFNAHRIILGMRSTVFSTMLESDMVEDKTGLIKVEDFTASILQSFLRYLYCGMLPEMNGETVKQFYEIADKYAIEELKQVCSEFLTKNLSQSNACEILVFADQHNDEVLRMNIISYIIEEKIPQHDCWLDFSKSYPILAVEVLNLYVRKNCTN